MVSDDVTNPRVISRLRNVQNSTVNNTGHISGPSSVLRNKVVRPKSNRGCVASQRLLSLQELNRAPQSSSTPPPPHHPRLSETESVALSKYHTFVRRSPSHSRFRSRTDSLTECGKRCRTCARGTERRDARCMLPKAHMCVRVLVVGQARGMPGWDDRADDDIPEMGFQEIRVR